MVMSELESHKQARKGTKSCTECRRRKIRCIRVPEDAETCRSCTDRHLDCTAQIYSSRPLRAPRLPSRHRISQLESEVIGLRKAVREIQSKLGYQTLVTEPDAVQAASSPEEDESEEESNVSDVVATEQPSHLRSLFQNDWLSADSSKQNDQVQIRKARASAQLLDVARVTLQKLIPSKEDVWSITKAASTWLDLVQTVLMQPFGHNTQQELRDSYDEMVKSKVDTMTLAAWLLDVALTARQEPQTNSSPGTSLSRFHKVSDFCRAVSDTVESTLFSHDRLMGTFEGLGMAMHFLRLQISRGNFHKAWIRVRHCIALAELLGLSKTSSGNFQDATAGDPGRKLQNKRIQLWEFMCSAERLSGMIVNKPPISRRIVDPNTLPLTVNGTIQIAVYVSRLTDITAKFHTLEAPLGASAQAFASALELDRELKILASQTPKSWWMQDMVQVKPENLCQLMHYYFVMRVHLPFTLRQNENDGHLYSRLTCIEACEAVAQRYCTLRRLLPLGIFLSPIMDLQALTATVALLLTTHSGNVSDRLEFQANKARVQDMALRVLKVMEEKAGDTAGANFARQGAFTIRSLSELLQQSEGTANSRQLNLNVPLLGNINIRRNMDQPQPPLPSEQPPSTATHSPPSGAGLWNAAPQGLTQPLDHAGLSTGHLPPLNMGIQGPADWHWNPLSWSIEAAPQNTMLQDVFMTDNMEPLGMWDGDYSNFQL